jgi:DeoR family glycerol-3-phosphate regulon repressor
MPRPIAARRHDEIVNRLRVTGTVSVEELATLFGVSRETIRRDLKALGKRGQLDIVHGGAMRRGAEVGLSDRRDVNASGKAAIGIASAALVQDGMVVLIDAGATMLAIAEALVARSDLTVVTNGLPIALALCRVPGTRVHIIGGEIDRANEASFGIEVIESLGRFRFDLAFVTAAGISDSGEITDTTLAAAEQRSRMMAAANRSYLVADSTKFGRLAPIRIPRPESLTALIVDHPPPRRIADSIVAQGLEIIVAAQ